MRNRLTLAQLRNGWFGVDIFFTISGFLITTLLLRERDQYGIISLRRFYIRRVLRIFPIYYATLALYVASVLLIERHTREGAAFFRALPGFATFTYTWMSLPPGAPMPHFNFAWSLCTEEQFYLLWPFALTLLRRPWHIVLMFILLGTGIAFQAGWVGAPAGSTPSLPLRMAMSISPAICVGALLAVLLHHPPGFDAARRLLGHRWSAPAALLLLALILASTERLGNAVWRPLACVALPLLIGSCTIREDNGLARVLRWPLLVHIGVLSYGMYLFNTLCVKGVRPAMTRLGLGHPVLVFGVVTALAALIAWISYRYFESRFLALKERFARLRPLPHSPDVGVASAAAGVSIHP